MTLSSEDTIGDLKKLIAAQTGTRWDKIVLKKWWVISWASACFSFLPLLFVLSLHILNVKASGELLIEDKLFYFKMGFDDRQNYLCVCDGEKERGLGCISTCSVRVYIRAIQLEIHSGQILKPRTKAGLHVFSVRTYILNIWYCWIDRRQL